MRAFIYVDGQEWEEVIRGAARYLSEGEAILVYAVDERAPRGYELSLRALLGRRGPRSGEEMAAISELAAEGLLTDAEALLRHLRPNLAIRTLILKGLPEEEIVQEARKQQAETIFVGRGTPEAGRTVTVSGVLKAWKRNHHGDPDGLYLDEGTDVRFPPHKASQIRAIAREGRRVEAQGEWHGHHLHAHRITDPVSGTSVEAHEPPGRGPKKEHLGHTARFITDHAPCDVVILRLRSL